MITYRTTKSQYELSGKRIPTLVIAKISLHSKDKRQKRTAVIEPQRLSYL